MYIPYTVDTLNNIIEVHKYKNKQSTYNNK